MNKLKFSFFIKNIKSKNYSLTVQIFLNLLNRPTFLKLRGKVDQLSKKKRVLCWSIYIIIPPGPGQAEPEHHPVHPGVPQSHQRVQRRGEGQNLLQGKLMQIYQLVRVMGSSPRHPVQGPPCTWDPKKTNICGNEAKISTVFTLVTASSAPAHWKKIKVK